MLRKYFSKKTAKTTGRIKWRSHEPTRIEAFSDAVFAFAVSLLVFSLEVPKTSEELINGMKAFFPFLFCFGVIFSIWHAQYKFFRHYGMHDNVTIILNALLVAMVLGYMYPLKFMVSGWMLHGVGITLRREDILPLMFIYNGGFSVIYLLFSLMYYNAHLRSAELKLTPVEEFETVTYIYNNLIVTFVGVAVIIAAVIFYLVTPRLTFIGCSFYWLLGPLFAIVGKRREKLFHKKFGNMPEPVLGDE